MWARILELVLAAWLAASPWTVAQSAGVGERFGLQAQAAVCAGIIAVLALCSFRARWRRLHWGNMAVAMWLLGVAYVTKEVPAHPMHQNFIIVGFLLLMFAVIPSHASEPPPEWREFWKDDTLK